MEEAISAADAKRNFSSLLRGVREGQNFVVTSHGRPVARIIPADKRDVILPLLLKLPKHAGVIPVQVLGELFNVLTRNAGRSRKDAREVILGWRDAFQVVDTTFDVTATDIATDRHFAIWDAVIVAVASHAGCRLLLSEDMQDGFTWGGTTIVNPFAPSTHVLLEPFSRGAETER